MTVLQAESSSAVLQREPARKDRYAGSEVVEQALDQRDCESILVDDGKMRGISLAAQAKLALARSVPIRIELSCECAHILQRISHDLGRRVAVQPIASLKRGIDRFDLKMGGRGLKQVERRGR